MYFVTSKALALNLMLDLNLCDINKLNSIETCFKLLNELPDHIGMTKITMLMFSLSRSLVPEDEGITGTVIIAESHLSVHTFPKSHMHSLMYSPVNHFKLSLQ